MPVRRCSIEFITPQWERFDEVVRLGFAVLYEPFGLSWPEDPAAIAALAPEPGTHVAVALDSLGVLLGSARLLPEAGDTQRQVRQVAVSPDARRCGVGRALMLALEDRAAAEGAQATWLNARNTAYAFYESIGYELYGEEFISEVTGIPHRAARKRLG